MPNVEVVIAIKATIVAILQTQEGLDPISKPKTKAAPIKPKKTPIHCLIDTFSSNIGPLKHLLELVEV